MEIGRFGSTGFRPVNPGVMENEITVAEEPDVQSTMEASEPAEENGEYLQSLGSLFAELASALGGPRRMPSVASREQLVEPMQALLDAAGKSRPRPAMREPVNELMQLLQAVIAKLLGGGQPNLGPLGNLSSQILSQMPKQAGQGQRANIAPPPGMKHEEFISLQKQIDEHLSKNNIGSLRDIANNPRFLACATPDQKAAMARALSRDSQGRGGEGTSPVGVNPLISANDRTADRMAINKIVGSSASSEEFRAIVEGAGVETIRDGMAPNPKDPKPDKCSADFDTFAGAFGCADLAASPEQARAGERAVQKGYSPQEVVGAREKINYYVPNKINPVPEDPLLSSVVSADEKAAMIYTMKNHDFRNNDKADRTIANLAMTSGSKEEYDALMDKAGSNVMSIQEKEAKGKVEKLAAGYGRTDLVTDPDALKYKDALIDPAKRQKYMGGAAEIDKPRQVEQGKTPEDFEKTNKEYISAELERMDPVSRNETVFTNVERESQGKPPLNPVELRKEAARIAESKSGDSEQKIKDACKREGLSDYTARNLVSQPCARAYERGGSEAAGFLASQIGPLEEKLARVIETKGPFSAEAKAVREQIDGIKKKMDPYIKDLNEVAGKFNNMFPPPSSVLDDMAKFFVGIFENVLPVLLNVIPYVGPALYAGYQGVRAVVNMAQGNFLGALGSIASALPGIGSAIGGVMKGALGAAGNFISKGAQAIGAVARGDIGGLMSSVGGGLDVLKGVGGAAGKVFGQLSTGAEIIGRGTSVVQGLATGNLGQVAGGMTGFVDSMGVLAKNNADVGKLFHDIEKLAPPNSALGQLANQFGRAGQVGGAFMTGNFEKIQGVLSDPKLLAGLPLGTDLSRFINTGAVFAGQLQKGKIAEAFDTLAKSKDPLLHGIGALFQDGNAFAASLAGDLNRTLGGAGNELIRFAGDDGVKKVTGLFQDVYNIGKIASETGFSPALLKFALGKGPALLSDPAIAKALEFSKGAATLMNDLAGGKLSQGLNTIGDAANRLLGSDAWKDATSLFRSGENLMQSVYNGSLEKVLSQPGLDAGIRNAANTVLDFSRAGRDFFSTIESQALAPQLAALVKAAEQPLPEFAGALREIAGGASVFGELAGGSFGEVLNAFESQLQALPQLADAGSPLGAIEQAAMNWVQKQDMEQMFLQNLTAALRQEASATKQISVMARINTRF